MSLLTPSLAFDRAAIMRAAHAHARATMAEHARLGCDAWPYALALKHALHSVWLEARVYRESANREARLAKASLRERAIASLETARLTATMIDSTTRMLSEVAAIDTQLASLRVSA